MRAPRQARRRAQCTAEASPSLCTWRRFRRGTNWRGPTTARPPVCCWRRQEAPLGQPGAQDCMLLGVRTRRRRTIRAECAVNSGAAFGGDNGFIRPLHRAQRCCCATELSQRGEPPPGSDPITIYEARKCRSRIHLGGSCRNHRFSIDDDLGGTNLQRVCFSALESRRTSATSARGAEMDSGWRDRGPPPSMGVRKRCKAKLRAGGEYNSAVFGVSTTQGHNIAKSRGGTGQQLFQSCVEAPS